MKRLEKTSCSVEGDNKNKQEYATKSIVQNNDKIDTEKQKQKILLKKLSAK